MIFLTDLTKKGYSEKQQSHVRKKESQNEKK